ncbi:copper radical oxidase [Colletotrichum tofieldiae]|uniref:Copper radical oxidase n=1 Tax=Colletotrichum tofieldiae TaxID=708197 RepID=A0A161WLN1_9PEZI|nr:copper radical oxidase [Colletotrichum tofieldiae]
MARRPDIDAGVGQPEMAQAPEFAAITAFSLCLIVQGDNASRPVGFWSGPVQVCAKTCAAVDGCTVWAVDRGNWPTDMSAWSCLMYNFNGRNYLLNNSPSSAFSRYAWSDNNCYNCTLNQQALSQQQQQQQLANLADTTATFSAPPLVTSCNRPTAAQWYTNGCTMSGVATAATSLLAVATGIAPNSAGDFNFEPAYQRRASICAGIAGCQGCALDRTNTTGWNRRAGAFEHNHALHPGLHRNRVPRDDVLRPNNLHARRLRAPNRRMRRQRVPSARRPSQGDARLHAG